MLGASHALLLGSGAAAQTYRNAIDRLDPVSHWPLANLLDRKGISDITSFGSHETGLPPIALQDGTGFARGFNGTDAYGTIEHKAAYQVAAGGVFVLMQADLVATKMQVFNSGLNAPGSMALEMEANGQPRAYRYRSDGSAIIVAGDSGQIVAGKPYLYGVTWGPNGLRLWLMDGDLQPGLIASDPETDWSTVSDTATKYLGRWSGTPISLFDGVLGHLQFYGTELNERQIESLALPQQVVWLGDFDAGAVQANGSVFVDFTPRAHPASGYTPTVVSQPSRGVATAMGTGAQYTAGGTAGDNDTFTAKVTAGGIESRVATITIDVTSATTGLIRPTPEFAVGQDSLPAGNLVFISPTGSNGNPGTLASPRATLEGAMAVLPSPAPNWTIVCRGGTYPRTSALQPNKSGTNGNPITVMAFPGETVIMDCASEFAAFRTPGSHWTLVDPGRRIWRSNSGGFAPGRLQGHWEEAGEHWFIWGYLSDGGNQNTSSAYEGPMARVHADGFVYLRFQRPSPARTTSQLTSPFQPGVSGGVFVVPGTENPNDYPVYLSRRNNSFGISWQNGVSDWRFKDINWVGPDFWMQFASSSAQRITFERGYVVDARYGTFTQSGRSTTGPITLRRITATNGRLDYFPYDWLKSLGGANSGQMDNNAFIGNDSSGPDVDWTIEDCAIFNYHDLWAQRTPPSNIIFRYNWVDTMQDDANQFWVNANGINWHHNVFYNSPWWSWSSDGGSSAGNVYMHHNLCVQLRPRLYGINSLGGPHNPEPTHFFSGASGRIQPQKRYNNTIIIGSSCGDFGQGTYLCHHANEAQNTDAGRKHESYNNILLTYGDQLRTVRFGSGQHDDVCFGHVIGSGTNEIYDNNHYARVLAYSTPNKGMFFSVHDRAKGGSGQGSTYEFARLSNLKSSPSNLAGVDLNSTDEQTTGVGLAGMPAASPLVSIESLDFRPKPGNAATSGAKDLTGTGWPETSGITANSYRGALDPNGSGSEIGPRS